MFAFGSIVEGISSQNAAELVNSGLALFANLMGDEVCCALLEGLHFQLTCLQHVLVSESAAWTVGRVCRFHAAVVSQELLPPLVSALKDGLMRPPRVASNCCWAISNLSTAFERPPESQSYPMSYFYGDLMETLLRITERNDANENNLRAHAYTTVNTLVQTGAQDCMQAVFATFNILVERLQESFKVQVSVWTVT